MSDEQDKYIRRLELTLKKLNRENKDLISENQELKARVAKVMDDMRELVRYELKLEKKTEHVSYAEVVPDDRAPK